MTAVVQILAGLGDPSWLIIVYLDNSANNAVNSCGLPASLGKGNILELAEHRDINKTWWSYPTSFERYT